MTIHDNYQVDALIKSIQDEIVSTVTWIKDKKERCEKLGFQISEGTMNHVKEYVSYLQSEMDERIKMKQIFIDCIENLLDMPDVSITEFLAVKYRYYDYMTADEIASKLNISNKTLYRYLNKCKKLLEPVFAKVV